MDPKAILGAFDGFLAKRGLHFEAIVVGGAALNLLGVITRATKDCDILAPEIPAGIAAAARDFAQARRSAGEALADDWFNNGPRSLSADLPPGWKERVQPLFDGEGLRLQTLGRLDLLVVSVKWWKCERPSGMTLCDLSQHLLEILRAVYRPQLDCAAA